MSELEIELTGLEGTQRLASGLASSIELPSVIALSGTLGAGKTQLVRFAAESLGVPPEEVTSPTYVLLQRYRGRRDCPIYHLDFYRLKSSAEVWDLGFDELVESPALIFVEWAEKFPECLPSDRLQVHLAPRDTPAGDSRTAHLKSFGLRSQRLLERLQQSFND